MDLNSLVERSIADTLASVWFSNGGPPPLAPELILCLSILGILLIRVLPFGKFVDPALLSVIGLGAALYYGADWNAGVGTGPAREVCGGMMVFDSFTACVRLILLFFTILFVVFTKLTGLPPKEDGTDFYCLILGAILGMSLMVSANHLLMVFLAVEMASVPSYALAGIMRGQRSASEAALKYSIYGAGAAGVMLYGISLLAGLTNTAHLPSIASQLTIMLPDMARPEQLVLVLAALMIMVGLAFKLSAVPFHFWCPDIFEGATAEIAVFLSIASKAAALALLVRVTLGIGIVGPERLTAAEVPPAEVAVAAVTHGLFAVEDQVDAGSTDESSADGEAAAADPLASVRTFLAMLIGTLAVVTTTFGNLAAYGQTNMKRLLAYSTIAHAGYMMLPVPAALAVAAVSPEAARDAISAIVLYIGIYMFMNLGAFAIVAFLRNSMNTEEIADYAGLIKKSPVLVVSMALIMFSLVGLPPLAGFVGKFAIFAALADSYNVLTQSGGHATYLLVFLILGGINTAISLFYYLRVVKVMVMDPESDALSTHSGEVMGTVPLAFVAVMTLPVAILIVNWEFLAKLSDTAAHQLFG